MLGSSEVALSRAYDLAMLDLDGVVYVGGDAVEGAPAQALQHALGQADQPHAVVDAPRPEALLGQGESVPLAADAMRHRDTAAVETHLAMGRVALAGVTHHPDVAHERVARRVRRDDDLAGAPVGRGRRVGDGHDDGERRPVSCRREPLVPGDDVVVAIALGACLEPGRVGAGALRFGHGKARADLASRQRGQPARLLAGSPVREQELHVTDVGRLAVEREVPDGGAPQLLADRRELDQRQPQPSHRRREVRRPETARARHVPRRLERRGHAGPRLVEETWLQRQEDLVDEVADRGPHGWVVRHGVPWGAGRGGWGRAGGGWGGAGGAGSGWERVGAGGSGCKRLRS